MPPTPRRRPCRPTTRPTPPRRPRGRVGTSGSTGRPKRALLTADAARAVGLGHPPGARRQRRLAARHAGAPRRRPAGAAPLDRRGRRPGRARPARRLHRRGASRATAAPGRPVERGARGATRRSCRPSWPGSLDDPAGVEALRGLRRRARRRRRHAAARSSSAPAGSGVALSLTYGMSETAGGCVYDGIAAARQPGHIDNDRHVVLGGDTVAHGYLGEPRLTATRSPSTPTACGGSAPTTSATSTTTGCSSSTAAPTTSSTPAASRSTPASSRTRCRGTSTTCSTSSSSACPTPSGARPSAPQ